MNDLLNVKQAAERYGCTEVAFRHKLRSRQIPPEYVIKSGRSYRIKPEYFAVGTPANVIPFARQIDEELLGRSIARNLAADPAFASSMVSAILEHFMGDIARKAS